MNSLPDIQSVAALADLRANYQAWYPTVLAIAEAHGLSADPIEPLDGSSLVAGIGHDHVIKLIPSLWRREYDAEVEA